MFIVRQCRPCACIAPLFIALSMHSYICIVASRVDALDVQCVNVKHAMLEPNHKTVFGGYLKKMEGPTEATEDPAQGRKDPMP